MDTNQQRQIAAFGQKHRAELVTLVFTDLVGSTHGWIRPRGVAVRCGSRAVTPAGDPIRRPSAAHFFSRFNTAKPEFPSLGRRPCSKHQAKI